MSATYEALYAEALAAGLEQVDRPVSALDLTAGRGHAALRLFSLLPAGSRLVAISADRAARHALHERLDAQLRRSIFPRKESTQRLPFAPGVFDIVWASLASEPLAQPRAALRQALRVLRPGGQLLLAVPLRDTLIDLLACLSTFQLGSRPSAEQTRPKINLGVHDTGLVELAAWEELLRRAGATDLQATKHRFEVPIEPPPSRSPLFAQHLLPVWLGNDPQAQRPVAEMLDAAINAPFVLPFTIAAIRARRGSAELLAAEGSEASSST